MEKTKTNSGLLKMIIFLISVSILIFTNPKDRNNYPMTRFGEVKNCLLFSVCKDTDRSLRIYPMEITHIGILGMTIQFKKYGYN